MKNILVCEGLFGVKRKPAALPALLLHWFALCSGLTCIAKHWFLIFIFIKSRAAVTGGRNSNVTPAQSPNVMCYFIWTVREIKQQ